MSDKDYININRSNWNSRIETHVKSAFYNLDEFKKGASSLNSIELNLLEEIVGKKIAHLQCHFGQDTLSLARLGAQVAGLDFSEKAIAVANQLNEELGLDVRFVCADVYEANEVLQETYDIVFTSYGTIGWLPDLNRWAATIKRLLTPGGKLIFVEFHPVIWMFDGQLKNIIYSYFNKEDIIESSSATYTDGNEIEQPNTVSWNHSLSEVFQALTAQGFVITDFNEYDYSPYDCFSNTIKIEDRKFQIKGLEGKLPMVYSIVASI